MKKIAILFILCSATTVWGQGVSQALRYSMTQTNGSARFRAMSGAFGALGGDLSALNSNPAGSAVFTTNQFSASLNNQHTKNNSTYFGNSTTENNIAFDLNQVGAAFVFLATDPKTNWKKLSFCIAYENDNNFDNSIYAVGNNNQNSIANYFLYYANPNANQGGIYLSTLLNNYYEDLNYPDQQAYLGYYANVITNDPSNPNNDTYIPNFTPAASYYQENYVMSSGYNGKLAFNGGFQYKDNWYFGINLNTHFTDYTKTAIFYEENAADPTLVKKIQFENNIHTYGNGFSFQVGAIHKFNPSWRAGLSYKSPTWLTLNDEVNQRLFSKNFTPNYNPNNASATSNVIMVYSPYQLRTPHEFTGSLAYVFGKKGLISVDYLLKDYSNCQFQPSNEFSSANAAIQSALRNTAEVRIGAEYRIKQWSLRAGYRNEQSPYKNKYTVGGLQAYSGGFGFNFGATRLDLAYDLAQRNSQRSFFTYGFTDSAAVKTSTSSFTTTLTFEL
jgi:hypothetical protein